MGAACRIGVYRSAVDAADCCTRATADGYGVKSAVVVDSAVAVYGFHVVVRVVGIGIAILCAGIGAPVFVRANWEAVAEEE